MSDFTYFCIVFLFKNISGYSYSATFCLLMYMLVLKVTYMPQLQYIIIYYIYTVNILYIYIVYILHIFILSSKILVTILLEWFFFLYWISHFVHVSFSCFHLFVCSSLSSFKIFFWNSLSNSSWISVFCVFFFFFFKGWFLKLFCFPWMYHFCLILHYSCRLAFVFVHLKEHVPSSSLYRWFWQVLTLSCWILRQPVLPPGLQSSEPRAGSQGCISVCSRVYGWYQVWYPC